MIRQFAIGKNPVLLLNAVPAGSTIINLSDDTTARVWVSGDPNVSANNGFPLEALSSMDKPTIGAVYAVVDPASASPVVTLLIGDDLAGYENPIALAGAVAASLLVSGIPVIAKADSLLSVNVPAAGAGYGPFDISAYSSLIIYSNAGADIVASQMNASGDIVDQETFGNGVRGVWACKGTSLQLSAGVGPGVSRLQVTGSSRAPSARLDCRSSITNIDSAVVNPVAAGANIMPVVGNPTGVCSMMFEATAAVTTGYFDMIGRNGSVIHLTQTTELIAGVSNSKVLFRPQVMIPPGVTFRYNCTGAAGGAVVLGISQGQIP